MLITLLTLLYRLELLKYSRYFQFLKENTSSFKKAHQVLSETVATAAPHSDAAQSSERTFGIVLLTPCVPSLNTYKPTVAVATALSLQGEEEDVWKLSS